MADRVVIELDLDGRGIARGAGRARKEIETVGNASATATTKVGLLRGALNALKANAIVAGIAAIYGAFRTLGKSVEAAGVQQIAERKLEQALRNTGDASAESARKLKELASATQRVSNYGDETILTAQAMLLSFQEVGGAKGAEMLTQSLVDTAAGIEKTGQAGGDLNSVAAAMGRALTQGSGALTRYNVSLTDTQRAAFDAAEGMERVEMLTEILQENFGGLAQATMDPMKQLDMAVGDLQETLGKDTRDELGVLAMHFAEIAASEGAGRVVSFIGRQIATVFRGIGVALDIPRQIAGFFRVEVRETAAAVQEFVADATAKIARFVAGAGDVLGRLPVIGDDIAERYARASQTLDRFANATADVAERNRGAAGEARKARAEHEAERALREENARAASRLARATEEETDATKKATAAAKEYVGVLARMGQRIEELTRKKGDLLGASYAEIVTLGRQAAALERQIALRERLIQIGVSGPATAEGRLGPEGETTEEDARGAFGDRDFSVDLSETRDEITATEETLYRLQEAFQGLGPAMDELSAGTAAAFGRDAAAYKAVSLATATIAAYTAAAKMLSAGNPMSAAAKAVAVLGIGLGYVSTIASIAIPGGGGGGRGTPGRSPLTAGIGAGGYGPQQSALPPLNVQNDTRVVIENRVEPHDMFKLNTAIREQARLERAAFGEVSGTDYMTGEKRR